MNKIFYIALRYILLLAIGLANLFIIYLIAAPLTIYPVFFLISLFHNSVLLEGSTTNACELASNMPYLSNLACIKSTILFDNYYANIIPACIAGSAYYLLLILNLSTPMSASKRVKSLLFILTTFLFINIIRIFGFAMYFVTRNYEVFNIAHLASWYFGSTILVALLWFFNVHVFKIKDYPIYTDFKFIMSLTSQQRGKK